MFFTILYIIGLTCFFIYMRMEDTRIDPEVITVGLIFGWLMGLIFFPFMLLGVIGLIIYKIVEIPYNKITQPKYNNIVELPKPKLRLVK